MQAPSHLCSLTLWGIFMFLPFFVCAGVEPDPGTEGRKEPHPAGADAAGGGRAQPHRRSGPSGHARQRLHADLPLQAAIFLLLVAAAGRRGRGEGRRICNSWCRRPTHTFCGQPARATWWENVSKKKLHFLTFIVLCGKCKESREPKRLEYQRLPGTLGLSVVTMVNWLDNWLFHRGGLLFIVKQNIFNPPKVPAESLSGV